MATKTETKAEPRAVYDPWQVMREVFVPRAMGDSPTLMVSVNDRRFAVPKNRRTQVPLPVYEVVQNMLDQMEQNERAAEAAFPAGGINMGKI